MSIFAGLATGAEALKNLSDAIQALKSIQKWLFVQPKEAAAELSRVIGEVMKATPAVTEATDKLLQVIDEAKPNLSTLAQVGDGSLLLKIKTIRPHCHDIDLIAGQYLWQWLSQSGVSGPDAQQLRDFLSRIGKGDQDYFEGLEKFAAAVEEVATGAFKLSAAGKREDAIALLGQAAPDLFDARVNAIKLAQELTELQNDFRRQALGLPVG
jgi:methyl-accepting chemotaxis protein